MKKYFVYFLGIAMLQSCVTESDHQLVVSQNTKLTEENQRLQRELEEIKFGAPQLLADGKAFFAANEFGKAKEKLEKLLERHRDLPQSIEAKKILKVLYEEEAWQNALNSEELGSTSTYIEKYPQGKYMAKAKARLSVLKEKHRDMAFSNAESTNSSNAWKMFLNDYPEDPRARSIKEKIIRLEVDEIVSDSRTGRMPSMNNLGTDFSSSSTVEITNDTGCELTVRYSGPDARMIEIPVGVTRSIRLSSGDYKIAASACGANYAGTESLHGSYSSTFYITRSSY